MQEANVAAVDD